MKIGEKANSEIVGAIVLLAMAIAVFSVIYIGVLADEGPVEKMYTTITAHLEESEDGTYLIFDNEKGESLSPEDIINVRIANIEQPAITVGELLPKSDDDLWNIGMEIETRLELNEYEDIPYLEVYANIVNKETNSIVFYGILREGYSITAGSLLFPIHFSRILQIEPPSGVGEPDFILTCNPPKEFLGMEIDNSTVHICRINNIDTYILARDAPSMLQQNMMLKFVREGLQEYLTPGLTLVAIKGQLLDGRIFEGITLVRAQ